MINRVLQSGKINQPFLRDFIRFFIVVMFTLTQIQCATVQRNDVLRTPIERPYYLSARYEIPPDCQVISREPHEKGFDRIQIAIPPIDGVEQTLIQIDYYRSPVDGDCPALLISPILGGRNRVASHFAEYFSRYGYHCMVVYRPPDLLKNVFDMHEIDEQLRRAVIRDRVALNWLETEPGVDPNALGSFGVSYGGIKNVVLAGVEPRLKVNIFSLAGADLASVFMNSNLNHLKTIRETVLHDNGWSHEKLENHIRESMQTEPRRYAPYVNPETSMLFLARFDRTVPIGNGELLRKYLGYPRTVYLPAGHYTAALFTDMLIFPYVEKQALDFYDRYLKPLSVKQHCIIG